MYNENQGDDIMHSANIKIANKMGLHARPASQFVACANKFKSKITIRKLNDSSIVNAKSIVNVLSAAISHGTSVVISAEGVDETKAITALVDLIKDGFGEI